MNEFTKNMLNSAAVITPDFNEVAEMSAKFIKDGSPLMVDAAELLKYSHNSLRVFLQQHGIYVYPTTELYKAIGDLIAPFGESVIEIGAGNGVLSEQFCTVATDSFMQCATRFKAENSKERAIQAQVLESLAAMGATPSYGLHVEALESKSAMRKYRPSCCFGLYITHKWRHGDEDGNMLGVDEHWLLNRKYLRRYVMVGNLKVHQHKPLLDLPHREIEHEGLVVRAEFPKLNRIFVWDK